MFSVEQELEFNAAFLDQMVVQARSDIESWQKLKDENETTIMVKWTDHQKRPSHVVSMLAWTKRFLELLENRIQQNQLKQRELKEAVRFPAEWAVLWFQQDQILERMRDVLMCETRMACKDLKEKLLGDQPPFDRTERKPRTKPKKPSQGKVRYFCSKA